MAANTVQKVVAEDADRIAMAAEMAMGMFPVGLMVARTDLEVSMAVVLGIIIEGGGGGRTGPKFMILPVRTWGKPMYLLMVKKIVQNLRLLASLRNQARSI